jgi:hypothetical protein
MGKADPVAKPPTAAEIAKRKTDGVTWLKASGFTTKTVDDLAAKKPLKNVLLELHKIDEATWRAAGGS